MAYIGNIPGDKYKSLVKQTFSTSATATYTLDHAVSTVNDIELFLNNVRQEPTSAYTISGTTLTLASAITGSDSLYCIYQGRAVETIAPATGSVTNAMLAGSIANSKLANSSITLNGSAVSLGGSATIGGGGKIGQVIQTSLDGIVELTSSSGTFVDITGFNASITPSATDSKILINCSINYGGTGNLYGATRLLRGSTAIGLGASAGSRIPATVFTSSGDFTKAVNSAVQFLDTPSTTSATTYKLQVTLNSGQTFKLNSEGENIDNAANHRTISTMTLMEVLA